MRVLDSHLHLWDPSRLDYPWLEGPLAARFAGTELAGTDPAGAAVFVQAECVQAQFLDEVRWVAETAPATGVVGIVAGARLDRGAETEAHLAALAELPLASGVRIVGVRHLLQGEPDGTAATEAFQAGAESVAARGWVFDACVRSPQLPQVTALAAALPDLRIVLDHVGKPAVGTAPAPLSPDAAWVRDIRGLAAHANVTVKLSGLPAEAGGSWNAAQVIPFLDVVGDAFGPDRLLWGSDWPVSAVSEDGYRANERGTWLRVVADWAEARALDADAVLRGNAERCYRLA